MLNTSNSRLATKFNLRGKKRGGMCLADGGAVEKPAVSDALKKKDYYDTDISKVKVKAHKPKPDYYDTDISKVKVKAHKATPGKFRGGAIEGPGSSMSDSIPARLPKKSFVVPAEHSVMAEMLRQDMLQDKQGKASLQNSKGTSVRVSNGEHVFNPEEAAIIHKKLKNPTGINMLAPNSDKKFTLKNLLNHGNGKRRKK